MKVLFATKNVAKIKRYKDLLERNGFEVLTIRDLDFTLDIEETGGDAIENAKIKAKAYYEKTLIPTIGIDDTLYIEGIPSELEPKTHVRRVNGKELNDKEMLDYYTNLIHQYGGKLKACWLYGLAIYQDTCVKTYKYSKGDFYLVDKVCSKINPGYPLDSITYLPKYNKYLVELDEIYDETLDDVIDFIIKSMDEVDK